MKEEFRKRSKSTSNQPNVRLAVIGSTKVGKSAISVRFLTRRFIGEYQHNVENTYRRNIQFGNEVIEYDLKDSASMRENLSNHVTWATCIAVVYAITDRTSFVSAASILDEINTDIHTDDKNQTPPCLALIGNKKDLEHLREIPNEEGKVTAKKYGAGFWEVSAADDYYSTFTPLNSLIIESYLNSITAKKTDNYSRSGKKSNKIRNDNWLPTYSGRSSVDSESEDFDLRRFATKNLDEDSVSITSSVSVKEVRKKRKFSAHEFQKQYKSETDIKISLDNIPIINMDDNNNNVSDTLDSEQEKVRSNSWSRTDKKRSSIRKTTDTITELNSRTGLRKSKSYSDLMNWEKEKRKPEGKKAMSSPSSRVKTLANEFEKHGGYINRTDNEKEIITPGALLVPGDKTKTTSSYSKLSTIATPDIPKQSGWSKVRKERKNLVLGIDEIGNVNALKSPDSEQTPKLKRNEHKKSVRRKFSSIFRPKPAIESATNNT